MVVRLSVQPRMDASLATPKFERTGILYSLAMSLELRLTRFRRDLFASGYSSLEGYRGFILESRTDEEEERRRSMALASHPVGAFAAGVVSRNLVGELERGFVCLRNHRSRVSTRIIDTLSYSTSVKCSSLPGDALHTSKSATLSPSAGLQQLLSADVPRRGGEKIDAGNKFLLGKSEEELVDLAVSLGEQKYRGKQIHQLLYKTRASSIEDFHHLPKVFKEALVSEGWQVGRSPTHHVARSADGTIKVLLRLADNLLVETVGIPVQDKKGAITRLTACVSSQVGCALRCAFCATGKGGFSRNLKAHEIVEQVLAVEDLFKHRVSNVVFMGMGEPMMNLTNVLAAHRSLNKDILIGQRMMTISTVGVPNTIAKLATHKLQSTLAISLHAPNQELRSQIVPSAKGYPLEALLRDCQKYFFETGRRVSFEYTLLDGVNDGPEHAEELANLLHHWKLGRHVNVIPYNPIADSEFLRPKKAAVMAFVEALGTRKVTASIRQTRGLDANAACGQLRNDFQKIPISVV